MIKKDLILSEEKLRGILEYCLLKGSDYGKVPKTKLFKLIYLADFSTYYFCGNSITEQTYRNREYGPVPDVLFALVDQMIELGDIEVTNGEKAKFHKLIVEPRYINLLSKKEKELVNKICEYWKNKPSEEIVKFVHDQRPWSLTKNNEAIPYELILQENHPFLPS